MVYRGSTQRWGAATIKEAVQQRLGGRAPWVQAVVVVWGDFPQARHEEQDVVYVSGDELRAWLAELPSKMNAPQRAALVTALQKARGALGRDGKTSN